MRGRFAVMTSTIEAVLRQPAAQAVGWALLQFVWQGAAVGVLTAIALAALRRSASDVRYVVSAIGLALMLTLPVVSGVQKYQALTAASATESFRLTAEATGIEKREADAAASGAATARGN